MSTHVSFERHIELARQHEQKAQHTLREVGPRARPEFGASETGPEHPEHGAVALTRCPVARAKKFVQCAIDQQRLAVRELTEASRLKPRNLAVKQQLRSARTVLRKLQAAIEAPKPRPLGRFLAHYNLSIRYWDLGKADQALLEAKAACKELVDAGLDCGCAEHNLTIIKGLQSQLRQKERECLESVTRSPEAINPNYELGLHYFDKRMLLKAEAQLKWTQERARHASALQLVEHERQRQLQESPAEALIWADVEGKKERRLSNVLFELQDDLNILDRLQERWCVEPTGLRDGPRPQLLPCLQMRFGKDCARCEAWAADLCSRTDVDLQAMPTQTSRESPVASFPTRKKA